MGIPTDLTPDQVREILHNQRVGLQYFAPYAKYPYLGESSFGESSSSEAARTLLDARASAVHCSTQSVFTGEELENDRSFQFASDRIRETLPAHIADLLIEKKEPFIERNRAELIQLFQSRGHRGFERAGRQWENPLFQTTQIDPANGSDMELLVQFLGIDEAAQDELRKLAALYHISINPHYLTLINRNDLERDPIRRVFLPYRMDMPTDLDGQVVDPSGEANAAAIGDSIRQRYPLTLVAYVNLPSVCSAGCGYCQRHRMAINPASLEGVTGAEALFAERESYTTSIDNIVEEVRGRPQIIDLLLSGGDALMLAPRQLDRLLTKLFELPQFKYGGTIRLGTKVLPVNPWRATHPEYLEVLQKHCEAHPGQLYIVTHIVHPREITAPLKECVRQLKKVGVAGVLNQAVLLKGVNDKIDPATGFPGVLARLMIAAKQSGIDPYYLFLPKVAAFSDPFSSGYLKAQYIVRALMNSIPGPYRPTAVISGADNRGKMIVPTTMVAVEDEQVKLTNHEGQTYGYRL